MSKLARKLIDIPKDVTVAVDGALVSVKGPKGELKREIKENIIVLVEEGKISVKTSNQSNDNSNFVGLTYALIKNMVKGVSEGFKIVLEFTGVGYKAQAQGNNLELNLGFSHPISYKAPESIKFESDKTTITITGIDKQIVGQVAAEIRSYRKPEPYKGKGIHYMGEVIRRKAGKKAATTA